MSPASIRKLLACLIPWIFAFAQNGLIVKEGMKILASICFAAILMAVLSMSDLLKSSQAAEQTRRYAVGKNCTVQFRRDALGAAASLPISPNTGSINGAETAVSGTIKQVDGEWFVIERNSRELWIPKTVILMVEVQP